MHPSHSSLIFLTTEDNAPSAEEAGYNYKEMVRKDKRRWERADVDGNGVLSKEEFRSYLHPEDVPHMANITAIVSCCFVNRSHVLLSILAMMDIFVG